MPQDFQADGEQPDLFSQNLSDPLCADDKPQPSMFLNDPFSKPSLWTYTVYIELLIDKLGSNSFDPQEFFEMIKAEQDRKNRETAESFISDIQRKPQVLHYRWFLNRIDSLNDDCKDIIFQYINQKN